MSYLRDAQAGDMDTTKIGVDKELLQTLYQIGISGIYQDCLGESETIFEGLRAVRPKSEVPLLGLALTRFAQVKVKDAIHILMDDALELNPDNYVIRAYLAMILKRTGMESQAKDLCDGIIEDNKDASAVEFAKIIMNDIPAGVKS